MSPIASPVRESKVVTLRVQVDFNSRDGQGRIRVRREKLGAAAPGDSVIAFDLEDGTECSATLAELSEQFGYLTYDVGTARDIDPETSTRAFRLHSNRAVSEPSDGVRVSAA
jgi:hypothetical protein